MQVKQALCASAAVMLVMAGGAGAIAADRPAQAQAAGRQMRLSLPQQQVFALAEPKRKPSLFWHTFNKLAPFRK